MNPTSQMSEAGYPKPADTSYTAYTPLSVLGVAHFGAPWLCSSAGAAAWWRSRGIPKGAAPPSSTTAEPLPQQLLLAAGRCLFSYRHSACSKRRELLCPREYFLHFLLYEVTGPKPRSVLQTGGKCSSHGAACLFARQGFPGLTCPCFTSPALSAFCLP